MELGRELTTAWGQLIASPHTQGPFRQSEWQGESSLSSQTPRNNFLSFPSNQPDYHSCFQVWKERRAQEKLGSEVSGIPMYMGGELEWVVCSSVFSAQLQGVELLQLCPGQMHDSASAACSAQKAHTHAVGDQRSGQVDKVGRGHFHKASNL